MRGHKDNKGESVVEHFRNFLRDMPIEEFMDAVGRVLVADEVAALEVVVLVRGHNDSIVEYKWGQAAAAAGSDLVREAAATRPFQIGSSEPSVLYWSKPVGDLEAQLTWPEEPVDEGEDE